MEPLVAHGCFDRKAKVVGDTTFKELEMTSFRDPGKICEFAIAVIESLFRVRFPKERTDSLKNMRELTVLLCDTLDTSEAGKTARTT